MTMYIKKSLAWMGSVKSRYKAAAAAALIALLAVIGHIADFIGIYQVLGALPSRQALIDKMDALEKNRKWPEMVKSLNSIRSDGAYSDVQMYYSGVVSCRWDHYEKMRYDHYFSNIKVESSLYGKGMWKWLECAIGNRSGNGDIDFTSIKMLTDKLSTDSYYDVVYYVSSLVTDSPSFDYVSGLRNSAIHHLGRKFDFYKNSVLINKVGADQVDINMDYALQLASLGTLFDLAMAHSAGVARKDNELNIYTKRSCKTLLIPGERRVSGFPINILEFYASNLIAGIGDAGMKMCKSIVG